MQVLINVAVQSGFEQIYSDGQPPSIAERILTARQGESEIAGNANIEEKEGRQNSQREGFGLQDHCLQLLLKDTWVAARLVGLHVSFCGNKHCLPITIHAFIRLTTQQMAAT